MQEKVKNILSRYWRKKIGHKVQNSKNENHEIIDVIFGNLPVWKELSLFLGHTKRWEGSENKDLR